VPQTFFAAPGRRATGLADLLQRERRKLPRRKVVANPVLLVNSERLGREASKRLQDRGQSARFADCE
jgi:hypothetical protein